MSSFTKASNFLHEQLLNGAGSSAFGHISTGAVAGGAIGAGTAFTTGNNTMIGGALSGAAQGAMLGAGTRYASMQYTKGVTNFIKSTTDDAGNMLKNIKQSDVDEIGKFKMSHFVRPNSNNVHANYWGTNSTAYKQTPFQNYNPRFTDPKG